MKDRIPFTRQLRWRIVATHLSVVLVGVVVVLLMANIITKQVIPDAVQTQISRLVLATTEPEVDAARSNLLDAFRTSIVTAVSVAAVGAIIAGIGSGLLLARQIIRPLQQISNSSKRIAEGRYSERVSIPDSKELASVAENFNQMAIALEHIEQQRVLMIGSVAHELRTPLAGLAGYLEGLMDGLIPNEPASFREMYQEVRRLHRLVDDLQALSRVESGQISLNMEGLELEPIVERVVNQLRPQAEASGISLALDPADSGQTLVCGDKDRIAQILLNLIGNAIRYTPEGGHVAVAIASRTHQVEIVVEDDGIGIPQEALPYIFERFFRVDTSRSRRSGGSGIGLTIARHLAWAMGGELTASSPGEGHGSTFTLTLPRTNRPAPPTDRQQGVQEQGC